jgi:hypothetical protein
VERLSAAEYRKRAGVPPPGDDRVRPSRPEHLNPQRGRMNKTEAAYAQHLDALKLAGEIVGYRFEAMTLRLADRTSYTPDFLVETVDGPRLEFHEVKGFWRDDARVKFKVAAELFPMFAFVEVKRKERRWACQQIGR